MRGAASSNSLEPTGASASNARKRNWRFLVKPASIIAPDQAHLPQPRSYTSLPGCSETPFSPTAVYYLSFVRTMQRSIAVAHVSRSLFHPPVLARMHNHDA